MKYFKVLCNFAALRLQLLHAAFNQSRSKILYSIFGNLFPLILGPVILYFIKEDFKYSDLLAAQNLIIYSATFAISSMFIWKKNTSGNSYEMLLVYIFLILIITVFFAVSYINYTHKEIFNILTIVVFVFSILLYAGQEIYSGYLINRQEPIRGGRERDAAVIAEGVEHP
jgi:hypothetical protein